MTRLKGKVKSIAVKEVTEGMRVLVADNNTMTSIATIERLGNVIRIGREYKTLVVEYEECCSKEGDQTCEGAIAICKMGEKQLPLKYSQWQSAIDNGEVDSDKEVEFEIINESSGDNKSQYEKESINYPINHTYAKIIPQKKRMYSEEDMSKAFDAGFERGGFVEKGEGFSFQEPLNKNQYFQEIKKENV